MSWDRPEDDTAAGDKTEGVRIIGAEEAAEALERGDVAPRRGEGELKYGDRPAPPPEDVKPAMRFPLSADDSDAALRPRIVPTPPPPPAPAPAMPHWTDPPTGEVPKIVPEGLEEGQADDLEAWSSFATSGPRWRDSAGDWEEADFDAADLGHDEGTRVGALDDRSRPAPDDFFTVHEEEDLVTIDEVPPRVAQPPTPKPRPRRPVGAPVPGSGRDMPTAIATGVGLLVVAAVLLWIGPAAAMVLVTAIIVLCSAELFGALQRGGYQPATLLGLVATGGLVLGAYWKGEAALPLVLGLTTVFTMLWYLLGVTRSSPTMNAGVTVLAVLQIGLLGSFAALILQLPHGVAILVGTVLATSTNDIGALLVGQQVGRAPVAPDVSPNKTIEGVIGGAIVSILLTTLLVGMVFKPDPFTTGNAALLALCVAVACPLGDLAESMIKRDLGIKDMGTVLPGHGGLFDRFDGLLFALPVAFYLCRLLNIG
jgi:phosphatidate cytidylyltransferase